MGELISTIEYIHGQVFEKLSLADIRNKESYDKRRITQEQFKFTAG